MLPQGGVGGGGVTGYGLHLQGLDPMGHAGRGSVGTPTAVRCRRSVHPGKACDRPSLGPQEPVRYPQRLGLGLMGVDREWSREWA